MKANGNCLVWSIGILAATAVTVIVGALAFRDGVGSGRLLKVLLFFLAACFVGYVAYAIGSVAGGNNAIGQIQSGVPAKEVKIEMPWWPLAGALSLVICLLLMLIWLPENLGLTRGNDDKKLG